MDVKNLGIIKLKKLISEKKICPEDLAQYYYDRIKKFDSKINAFITVNDECIKESKESDLKKRLAGIPIAIKDVFSTKDFRTTCASRMLDNYIPTFESTVTKSVLKEGCINIGKTNLDQFCHGSSTATSYYFTTKNPWNLTKLPGGSSGGSAAAVAADMCAAALGTETAGSIRQPASWCGCVGMKPTYGRVSRYGVVAMGSSLDCPGPITKNVEDAAYLLSIIAGKDANDSTSANVPVPDYYASLDPAKIKGKRLGLPKEFMSLELEDGVRKSVESAIKIFEKLGARIVEVEMLQPKYAMAVYTVICRSEVSSNLSRFNGTRFGLPGLADAENIMKYFEEERGEGFGSEAKRRIMTGTFALSSGYSKEYYKTAEAVRQLLKENVLSVLSEVDAVIGPTAPTTALDLDSVASNPLFGEMADILIETSSLTGLPGISVPCGLSNGMPVGIQIFGRHFEEQLIFDIAKAFEDEYGVLTFPELA